MAERGLQVLRKLRFTCKAVFSVADIAENTLAKQGSRFSGPPLQCCASRHLKVFGFKGSSQSPSHSRSVATASSATRTRISSRKDNNEVQDQPPNFKLRPSSEDPSPGGDKRSVFTTSDFADYRGMQLVFLEGSIYLFDCGEGAVRQILQTPMKHYDIDNIFITHMHGDHVYMDFLEGLLCRLGLKEFHSKQPIQIYGPQGLRQWVRTTLKASHARVHPKYAVHELLTRKKNTSVAHSWNYVDENHEDELPGKDIERSKDGLWSILNNDKYCVRASFLRHTIPCWGYVIEEHTRRGRFDVERAREVGVRPGKYFRMLENGDSVMLASGKVVYPSDVLGPPRRGRKVVILGDTCDSKSLMAAAQEADLIVHEATVLEQDASEVYQRGHSTAKMAGMFARAINAGTLVLTHFSRKLDGALFVHERSHVRETIGHLVSAAQEAFEKDSVIAAEDMMAITIQLEDKPASKTAQSRHSSSFQVEDKLPPKTVRCGLPSPSQVEDKKLSSKSLRNGRFCQIDDKVPYKSVPRQHSSPSCLHDKLPSKSLCRQHSSPSQIDNQLPRKSLRSRYSSPSQLESQLPSKSLRR